MNERVRTIIAEVSEEMKVKVENGVVSSSHLRLFVVIPLHVAVSDFVQRAKGRSLRKVQQKSPELKKIYWGRRFLEKGYFLVLPVYILQMKLLMSASINVRMSISLTVYLGKRDWSSLSFLPRFQGTYKL